jgi:hypothetical protein
MLGCFVGGRGAAGGRAALLQRQHPTDTLQPPAGQLSMQDSTPADARQMHAVHNRPGRE